jgi:hypothetical protein
MAAPVILTMLRLFALALPRLLLLFFGFLELARLSVAHELRTFSCGDMHGRNRWRRTAVVEQAAFDNP